MIIFNSNGLVEAFCSIIKLHPLSVISCITCHVLCCVVLAVIYVDVLWNTHGIMIEHLQERVLQDITVRILTHYISNDSPALDIHPCHQMRLDGCHLSVWMRICNPTVKCMFIPHNHLHDLEVFGISFTLDHDFVFVFTLSTACQVPRISHVLIIHQM